jgi:hypothetical protein
VTELVRDDIKKRKIYKGTLYRMYEVNNMEFEIEEVEEITPKHPGCQFPVPIWYVRC